MTLIQKCRLYLRLATLADICNAAGNCIEHWIKTRQGQVSNLAWLHQGMLSKMAWKKWQRFLKSLMVTKRGDGGHFLKQGYRLGP